jgi:LysM repeat protein
MSSEIKCPVCGKVGIPDYQKSDVVCPCCGSDLKIYRVIEAIPAKNNSNNIWKIITASALVAVVVMALLPNKVTPEAVVSVPEDYTLLKDSIINLKTELAKKIENNSNQGFSYPVKKGDSYWSISKRFYGTGTKADQLAKNNNRKIMDTLHKGDVLIIK